MHTRLTRLRKSFKENELDAVFISDRTNIAYLTGFSGFGKEDRDAFLLITQSAQYIFTHGIYKEAVKKHIKEFELLKMTRENPTSDSIAKMVNDHSIKKLGFEADDLTVLEYKKLFRNINKKIISQTDVAQNLRIIKDPEEIAAIKKSCALGDRVFSFILKNIKIGVTEKELAFELEQFIRKNGAEPSFPTIVGFGANAAFPHHVSTDKKLSKQTFVLMDFGVKLNNYCSDMTRTVFFGKANDEQKRAYETVLVSQQKAIDYIEEKLKGKKRPIATRVDGTARDYVVDKGYPPFNHSSHGIGLEVHESPHISASKEPLESGMVFSIEPGIYLPGKFGIRIEDLFAIQNNKLVQLTTSPRNLIEI